MRNFFLIAVVAILMCGCSTPKITNSIWCTMEPVVNGKQEGLGVTSLYMYDNGKLDIYKSIVADSSMIVAPYLYAKGNYNISGNLKKEATITVRGENIKNQKIDFSGLINLNKKSIMLIEPGSTASFYFKYGNFTVE